MLIAQDLIWFASDSDSTGLTCFASDADCTGLTCFTSDAGRTGLNLIFASDANCTGLHLVSPRMLTAQDFILVRLRCWLHRTYLFRLGCWLHRTYLFCLGCFAQDLFWVRLGCWSHRTSTWFASDADCTGLNLVSPRMLITQDFILFASNADCIGLCYVCLLDWTYTFDARIVRIRDSLKTLICLDFLLSPQRSFWSFYRNNW